MKDGYFIKPQYNEKSRKHDYIATMMLTKQGIKATGRSSNLLITYAKYLPKEEMWLVRSDELEYLLSKDAVLGFSREQQLLDSVNKELEEKTYEYRFELYVKCTAYNGETQEGLYEVILLDNKSGEETRQGEYEHKSTAFKFLQTMAETVSKILTNEKVRVHTRVR